MGTLVYSRISNPRDTFLAGIRDGCYGPGISGRNITKKIELRTGRKQQSIAGKFRSHRTSIRGCRHHDKSLPTAHGSMF